MEHANTLTQRVIGCAVEVHRTLGPGLLEGIYEACLCHELAAAGLAFLRQHHLAVVYKGHPIDHDSKIDVLVERTLVLEIKSVHQLLSVQRGTTAHLPPGERPEAGAAAEFQ